MGELIPIAPGSGTTWRAQERRWPTGLVLVLAGRPRPAPRSLRARRCSSAGPMCSSSGRAPRRNQGLRGPDPSGPWRRWRRAPAGPHGQVLHRGPDPGMRQSLRTMMHRFLDDLDRCPRPPVTRRRPDPRRPVPDAGAPSGALRHRRRRRRRILSRVVDGQRLSLLLRSRTGRHRHRDGGECTCRFGGFEPMPAGAGLGGGRSTASSQFRQT